MAEADAGDLTPSPVGERLRIAREAAGLSLDDVATRTRVPTRHLDAMETGAWSRLPGPTYVVGFAKSYADVVGLDRVAVGEDIRAEMGGGRAPAHTDTFQPADPARIPPRTLAIGATLLAVVIGGGYLFLREDALDDAQPQILTPVEAPAPQAQAVAPAAQPRLTGPVVLTARENVWVDVRDRGGPVLAVRELKAGERLEVPASYGDPILRTGAPERIDVTVGGQQAPPLGAPAELLRDKSLRPDAVLSPTGAAPQPTAPPTRP